VWEVRIAKDNEFPAAGGSPFPLEPIGDWAISRFRFVFLPLFMEANGMCFQPHAKIHEKRKRTRHKAGSLSTGDSYDIKGFEGA
jgi:hypothetical protein